MNKRRILLFVGLMFLVLCLGVGCAGPEPAPRPETVSKAEYQEFRADVQGELGRINTELSEIDEVIKDLPEIKKETLEIKEQLKELCEVLAGVNEQRALGELSVKMAAIEKDVTELRDKAKEVTQYPYSPPVYLPSYPLPYPPCYSSLLYPDRFGIRVFSVWFEESGNYKFKVETDNEFRLYIDGQLILSGQARNSVRTYSVKFYLARGYHDIELEYPRREEEPVFGWHKY